MRKLERGRLIRWKNDPFSVGIIEKLYELPNKNRNFVDIKILVHSIYQPSINSISTEYVSNIRLLKAREEDLYNLTHEVRI